MSANGSSFWLTIVQAQQIELLAVAWSQLAVCVGEGELERGARLWLDVHLGDANPHLVHVAHGHVDESDRERTRARSLVGGSARASSQADDS